MFEAFSACFAAASRLAASCCARALARRSASCASSALRASSRRFASWAALAADATAAWACTQWASCCESLLWGAVKKAKRSAFLEVVQLLHSCGWALHSRLAAGSASGHRGQFRQVMGAALGLEWPTCTLPEGCAPCLTCAACAWASFAALFCSAACACWAASRRFCMSTCIQTRDWSFPCTNQRPFAVVVRCRVQTAG